MSVPYVQLNEQDGNLGVLPSGQKPLVIVGPADAGPLATPVAYGRTKDVIGTFSRGLLVHAACYAIQNYSRPVVLCRTATTTAATEAAIDVTGVLGTSVVTYGADTTANDDYDLYLKVVTGGTIGTSGITYQWSLDGGRTLSVVTALGTANTFAFPESGGVGFAFAAGTLLAGDVVRGRTTGPMWNAADIGASLGVLANSAQPWEIAQLCGAVDATLFDAIETAYGGSRMSKRAWIGHARMPNNGETEAAYLTAMSTAFGAKATTRGVLCYGAAKITSGADFRKYRRPISHYVAALASSVSEEVDLADFDLGSAPGVSIRDANGNADEHDEFINPGADDARFTTLRTDDEIQGVYPTNARLFSAAGSDFKYLQHRRVMSIYRSVVDAYFKRRLSKPITVSKKTGFILEAVAVEMETEVNALCAAALLSKPKVSGGGLTGGGFVKVSRTDNLLSTETLTGQGGVIPLAYPKAIIIDLGFRNPALQIVAV